ncbi:MAG TPA: NAD-dependent deacylase [Longimicrobiaceae bacterium]|nr:NAD-dependent deacylase [Longimicrobiaceae bacterium]
MTPEGLERAVRALARAGRVVASTGAGMSRESGIPTFRDAREGLWARYDPEELATERGFRADPRLVWSWYTGRRRRISACEPHAGHRALAELERLVPGLTVVTQNIDGLHALAGSSDVVELHGNIHRAKCLDAHHPFNGELPDEDGDPPPCPRCGSPLRPDVVWFGEVLPEDATARAWRLAEECDVMLVVGTSGLVYPAADLPRVARRAGARIVEVNPEPSGITPLADVFLQGTAGTVLPALVDGVRRERAAPG